MLYFISGDDSFNVSRCINKIVNGRDQVTVDMNTIDYSSLMTSILSVDLFQEPKVYILEGFKGFSNKSEKYSKANAALLEQIFNSSEEMIIVNDKKLNRQTIWYEKFGSGMEVHEFELQELDFDTAFEKFIEEHQIQIETDSLELIKSNFPNNIYGATNDILKIWEYTNHNSITVSDVKAAGQVLTEHKIFELYNLIITGRTAKAITYLEVIRNEGISDSDILLVSFTQIKRMYETKLLINKGLNDFKIASQIGSNPYATKQNRRLLANVSEKRLEEFVFMLADFDFQFKSGANNPSNLVDLLVIK